MDTLLMPFIKIYHLVNKIGSIPSNLFYGAQDKLDKSSKNAQSVPKSAGNLNQVNNINNINNVNTNSDSLINQTAKQINEATENTSNRPVLPKKKYRYIVINAVGKKENSTFEAESVEELRNFLLMQGYQVLQIKERDKFDVDINIGNKLKVEDLSFMLTQLSTYIKAGIPLVDSVKILAKQTTKPVLKKSYYTLVYELLRGQNLSDAMIDQGDFYPKLLINMIKTAEMTGDLPSILDDMADYYTTQDQTRKQMISAMIYPAVVLTVAIGVLVFMLVYLVPQFASMFEEQGAELPALTKAIMDASNFLVSNYIVIISVLVVFIVSFILLYKKVQKFREYVQIAVMHVPVFKDIIIYNEMANFTNTFASLINHGVFITDSMEILGKITNNEVYKRIINNTLEHLAKGDSVSEAFKGEWAVPVVAYEMLVTGESTGQLGEMLEKVAKYFQMMHKNIIDRLKSLIEPFMILCLGVIVGIILLSIVQPMFSMYENVQ